MAQLVKNPPPMQEPGFDYWVGKIPWRREWLPTPVFWPGAVHGQSIGLQSRTRLSDFHSLNAFSDLSLFLHVSIWIICQKKFSQMCQLLSDIQIQAVFRMYSADCE